MPASISGLGSGFDINSWVSQLVAAKQSTSLSPLQSKLQTLQTKSNAVSSLKTKFSTLQSSLKAFTNIIYDSSSDIWNNSTIESSNSSYATATSTGSVSASSVDLEIQQIATATTASSTKSLGTINNANADNVKFVDLANGQATAGSFSMFLNGKEYSIDIEEEDTLKDVMNKISDASNGKIKANVSDDGIFSIKAYKENVSPEGVKTYIEDSSAKLSLGSSGDTSNILGALKLHEAVDSYSYSSSYAISTVNTGAAITDRNSGLNGIEFFDEAGNPATSGKISINGIDFDIDENTTLNGLISKINSNSDVNVKASYDSLTNKLILTSSQTGQSNISLSEQGTNLLNVLGLTEGYGDDEVLAQGSQVLGQNAIVYINGNKVVSTSNTITGESSGISNLSITVKKPTSEFTENNQDEKSINLSIERDFTDVKEALKKFVDSYNDVVNTTKSYAASDGQIGYDSSLNSILGNMRSLTSTISKNNGDYTLLSDIGISASRSDTSKLSIDEKKLDKALAENFDSVKALLSDGYVSKSDNGLFDTLLNHVNNVLDNEGGYFTNKDTSLKSQISSMNTRIERANKTLQSYEARLTAQFNAMDSTIAALTSQLSTFQAYMR